MRIPNSVRIGGVEYKVELVDHLDNGKQLAYGMIFYEDCKIKLLNSDNFDSQFMKITFLHEVLHGIIHNSDLAPEAEQEEEIVEMLGKGLFQFLQDNDTRLFGIKGED